ncbi:MAG: hydrolase [Flavobacteriaceae bacterium]|nr:hydrolase [Flavobacteriaceae bacterium]
MKRSFFMYLFFFALLFVIFQYMNEKKIFEKQENKIESQRSKIKKYKKDFKVLNDSIEKLSNEISDINYFTLQGNENAMSYIESLGYEAKDIENFVSEYIYDQNLKKGNNTLIPYEGMKGDMKINKLKFLNHKWIQVDFTDGRYWGEMILEYYVTKDRKIEFHQVSSLMYPSL